jgi:hypothetical protein
VPTVTILALLEYADVILDNNITYLVDKIEKVQMEAARIVTVGTLLVSLNNLCLEKITSAYSNNGLM